MDILTHSSHLQEAESVCQTSSWEMPKINKFTIIFATFLASPTTAETLYPIVPLVHTARLIATALLLFLPDAEPAAEFIIHGRTRNHIAKVGNDAQQRKKHTSKTRKPGKKGKGSKKTPRRPPTTARPTTARPSAIPSTNPSSDPSIGPSISINPSTSSNP